MTYQEFLQKLRETPRTWQVRDSLLRSGANCPLTAVAGHFDSAAYYADAAAELGVCEDDMCQIVWAADTADLKHVDAVRDDLLRACGLLPDETPVPTDAQTSRFLASVRSLIDQPLVETE